MLFFDSVRHELLFNKLNLLPLNAYIINWYHSFLIMDNNALNAGQCERHLSIQRVSEIKQLSTPALFTVKTSQAYPPPPLRFY